MKVYTLKSCDTCKKALRWLDTEGISYENHDIRADGMDHETVEHIVCSAGRENALNRRSTTWRSLSEAQKGDIDPQKAIELVLENPTLMKRPAFVTKHEVMVGFDDKVKVWLTD